MNPTAHGIFWMDNAAPMSFKKYSLLLTLRQFAQPTAKLWQVILHLKTDLRLLETIQSLYVVHNDEHLKLIKTFYPLKTQTLGTFGTFIRLITNKS